MSPSPSLQTRNRRLAWVAVATAVAMVGATYAAVPLYAEFCKRTGFAGHDASGARQRPPIRGERSLVVRFDANVSQDLDWTFEPETPSITLRTGATATVFFRVHNRSRRADRRCRGLQRDAGSGGGLVRQDFLLLLQRAAARTRRDRRPSGRLLSRSAVSSTTHEMDDVEAITLSYTMFAAADGDKPVALAPKTPAAAPKL